LTGKNKRGGHFMGLVAEFIDWLAAIYDGSQKFVFFAIPLNEQ